MKDDSFINLIYFLSIEDNFNDNFNMNNMNNMNKMNNINIKKKLILFFII